MKRIIETIVALVVLLVSVSLADAQGAPVPQTGQTTSFATGDDGDLQKGVALPDPRFTDNLNGTITDNLTGLIWLQNANCFGAQVWAQALAGANGLDSGQCGLTDGSVAGDWRLSNVRELYSLVDHGTFSPSLPAGHPFADFRASGYWSSTTVAGFPANAGGVGFFTGGVFNFGKTNFSFVLPVRGP